MGLNQLTAKMHDIEARVVKLEDLQKNLLIRIGELEKQSVKIEKPKRKVKSDDNL